MLDLRVFTRGDGVTCASMSTRSDEEARRALRALHKHIPPGAHITHQRILPASTSYEDVYTGRRGFVGLKWRADGQR